MNICLKNIKFFLLGLILSLPVFLGINIFQMKLEEFLFWNKLATNPNLLTAQVHQDLLLDALKPIRNSQIENLEIKAKSAISVFINKNGSEKILFSKNSDFPLPIASITKLMTANIVLKYYPSDNTEFSELLYHLLISSDNQAAENLASFIGQEAFVELMNFEAKKIGLFNTRFFNPTGLDPKKTNEAVNYSTAKDLVRFSRYLIKEQPLIWKISSVKTFGEKVNTNELLEEFSDIIVGGKTGETPLAGQCFLLIIQAPKKRGFIINVILNSENRVEEMKKMINWIQYAYKW